MADRKSFLLRADPRLLEALQRWANDDLRSLNAQIEFLLRRALQQAGRTTARHLATTTPHRERAGRLPPGMPARSPLGRPKPPLAPIPRTHVPRPRPS
ncbi:MAG: hypothetical protein R2712_01805 [Vicinamibacterales bacterium]